MYKLTIPQLFHQKQNEFARCFNMYLRKASTGIKNLFFFTEKQGDEDVDHEMDLYIKYF